MKTYKLKRWLSAACGGLAVAVSLGSTGCGLLGTPWQISSGGQTLPSAYYIQDDVQYFAPGPEFKLSREAAAQKAYKAEAELRRQ